MTLKTSLKAARLGLAAMFLWSATASLKPANAQQDLTSSVRSTPLVTFGKSARRAEGDHDFQQVVHISVPDENVLLTLQLFDPDIGGELDESQGGFDTQTRFSIYGARGNVELVRDEDDTLQERVTGVPIYSQVFGTDAATDGIWVNVATFWARRGLLKDGRREFFLVAEGISGNDGNVFDLAILPQERASYDAEDVRLAAILPTFQTPADRNQMIELRFQIPEDQENLLIENFDSAGATIHFDGKFRSRALTGSRRSRWVADHVDVFPGEEGQIAAISASRGSETPNDMTVAISRLTMNSNGEPVVGDAIPVQLPAFQLPNIDRPTINAQFEQLSCTLGRLDASNASQAQDVYLSLKWQLEGETNWVGGRVYTHSFSKPGKYIARVEATARVPHIRSSAAEQFEITFKDPPVARISAPELVALQTDGTATVELDGTTSTASTVLDGARITRMEWDFGDGTTHVQSESDEFFGRARHVYRDPGTYTITLRVTDVDNNPCNTSKVQHEVFVNAPPSANAGVDQIAVPGETIRFSANTDPGADGDLHSYSWTFSDGTEIDGPDVDHKFGEPGTYQATLKLDDRRGASNSVDTDLVEIRVNAPPNLDDVSIPQQLNAGEDRIFDASTAVDSDGRIIEYDWDFGDGTLSQEAAVSHAYHEIGDYEITLSVRDDSGLTNDTVSKIYKLSVVPPINLPPRPKILAVSDALVGEEIQLSAEGTEDPDGAILRYSWDFGDGSVGQYIRTRHAYREPGIYVVTLTAEDNSGQQNASASIEHTIVVEPVPNTPPTPTGTEDRNGHVDEVLVFDARNSRDADGSIVEAHWDFGDGETATGLEARHSYREPGTYTARLRLDDDSEKPNSSRSEQFTVTITHGPNSAPTINLAPERNLFAGVKENFNASSAVDPDGNITSYEWQFGDGATSIYPDVNHAYAEPGSYEGRLILIDDSGLENGRSVYPFTVLVTPRPNEQPVARAGTDVQTLVGQTITVDGGASRDSDGSLIRFHWDFGNGKEAEGQQRSIAYFEAGSYEVTLTVTDDSGQQNATARDTLTVVVEHDVNMQPIAEAGEPIGAAIDEPVPFTAAKSRDPDGNILRYSWDFGDGTKVIGRDVVHAYKNSGTYDAVLTITDDSGRPNDTTQAIRRVRVNEPPVPDAGPDRFVTASQVLFDASNSFDRDDKIIRYHWDFGDGDTAEGERLLHTYARPGDYIVTLTVTDDSETIRNQTSDQTFVRINALPIADAGFDQIGEPDEILSFDGSRSVDTDGSIQNFYWDFGDGTSAEGDYVEHAYDEPGSYIVELTVVDNSGHENAMDFSQVRVDINSAPVADTGPDVVVSPNEPFTLSALSSFDQDGEITAYRWDISGMDTPVEVAEFEHSYSAPGIYTATLTVTDDSPAGNNTTQDDVTISVNSQPVADAGRDQYTGALRVIFDGSGSVDADGDGLTYEWNFGDGNTASGRKVEHIYDIGGIYPVLLTVDDGRGLDNSTSTDSLTLTINRQPVAVAGESREVCVGDVVVFDASFSSDPDGQLLDYAWAFGDGAQSNLVNPTKIYEDPGTYEVSLKVTDESDAMNDHHTDRAIISVRPAPVARAGSDIEICAGAEVQFDGSASSDVDGVVNRYSWDFGDGLSGGGDKPTHVYDTPGIYRASLLIEGDNLGLCAPTSSDDLIVTVKAAPRPQITAPTDAAVGQTVLFKSNKSELVEGQTVQYLWQLDGQQVGQGPDLTYTFTESGIYRVVLRFVGDETTGTCSSSEVAHTIRVNAAPEPVIVGPESGEIGQVLSYSAEGSTDPDGGVQSYRWDFGDGQSGTGAFVSHKWEHPGTYTLKLTVNDGSGQSNSGQTLVRTLTIDPLPETTIGSVDMACAGQAIDFDLLNPVSGTREIEWRLETGKTATGRSTTHTFASSGTYSVSARMTGIRGGQEVLSVVAKDIFVNQSPVVVWNAPLRACAGQVVTFDAAKTFDPDGQPVSIQWQFGKGDWQDGATLSHAFEKPGWYPVKVRVQDPTDTACNIVEEHFDIHINAPPTAVAGDDRLVFVGGAIDAIILDGSRSVDSDGETLTYEWDIDGELNLFGQKVRLDEMQPGNFTVGLTVSDPHGLECSTASDSFELSVQQRSNTIQLSN